MADLFTVEQLDYLDKHFDEKYERKFVLIDDCNEKQEKFNGRFANDDKRIDLIIQKQEHQNGKLTLNNWLTFAILGAIITFVISYFLGG